MGIAYTAADQPRSPAWLAAELRAIVERESARVGLAPPRIAVEPGRAIAGPGTVTLYEVGTVKDVELGGGARRRYVSVDGGMSDNIRTALYDAALRLPAGLAARTGHRAGRCAPGWSASTASPATSWCATAGCPPTSRPATSWRVAATGAYCYAMASAYNKVPRPAVVAVADGTSRAVLRRETLDDLARLEVG